MKKETQHEVSKRKISEAVFHCSLDLCLRQHLLVYKTYSKSSKYARHTCNHIDILLR